MPPMSFTGIVTKVGCMNKTATVTVSRWAVHKTTGKRLQRSKKFLTHDENNQLRLEDLVLIRNCRPLSARKRFMLEKILKSPETERAVVHAKQAEEKVAALPLSLT
ncbi:nucleic acid-binding protein [Neolentinus lepideus HHB14362 ss-1]|uniref:Nucleic acid-binding protein n=1 Tax=Neolentinus lepideus HHB14362 ss-1 TaxID=1314782 RepID=A0A165RV23_9AGAM|nr:nucleic acid-binding protein [Neolentinus lepideus HHB14362 ss-1]